MTAPPWHRAARSQIGLREIPGPRHSAGVMALVARAKGWLGVTVTDDETAWCGTFVAACLATAGFTPPRAAVGARARWWATWGDDVGMVATRPPLGAIAVFERQGGGHVGFVESVNPDGSLNILGGNQGNAVSVARFPRQRLIAMRWPKGVALAGPAPWAGVASADTVGEA